MSTRSEVLRHRLHVQGLTGRSADGPATDCPVLDLGVQDTGPDGAAWAMEIRGHRPEPDSTVTAWTLRGAPHVYRRSEVAQVAAATAPFSEADAGQRLLEAGVALQEAGITTLEGLDTIAATMRAIVTEDTVKGAVSTKLSERLPAPYLTFCQRCAATHCHEQAFRIAALQAGLELVPGTSPPVLHRIAGWRGPARTVPPHLDVVRAALHLLGPASPKDIADHLGVNPAEVRQHWPDDVVEVDVDGARRQLLEADAAALADPPTVRAVRLLGPFDLHLQARDRTLLVPDPAARKDLWRALGRPGAVLAGAELVGSWRPRTAGKKLRVAFTLWDGSEPTAAMVKQAERLAAWRGQQFAGLA